RSRPAPERYIKHAPAGCEEHRAGDAECEYASVRHGQYGAAEQDSEGEAECCWCGNGLDGAGEEAGG
ncbi:UNVERIFIED_CONTAM: hypothetical protein NY603_33865, partial [Bacteroidetes bacterium 56_B9]